MANFGSELGSGLKNRLVPDESALDRKIDFQREKFLKGLKTTRSGKKEDPTYISFRFIFDFGNSSLLEEETFLPISPLFKKMEGVGGDDDMADRIKQQLSREMGSKNLFVDYQLNVDGAYKTNTDFFYGSKLKSENGRRNLFNMQGGVGYLGAQAFLRTRSEKRYQMLKAFGNGIEYLNKNSPWYFQTVSGLNNLVASSIPRYGKAAGKPQRAGELTINCLESIDMRVSALAELYRKAVYDYTHHRVMLPENLRKFRMWIVVTEMRNIQLDFNMSDVLNPFSVPAVAKVANVLSDFNSQTGLLDSTEKFLNRSTRPDLKAGGPGDVQSGLYNLQPYVYIYQLDQCEFDFDSTYPSFDTINNTGGQMVSTSFKIQVGRVKDYKLQFTELNEYKDDNGIKGMIISDTWGGVENYTAMDYDLTSGLEKLTFDDKPSAGDYFAQLASNFVTNTVATIKNEAVSFIESKLLGNIYGFQPSQLAQATNDAFSLVNSLKSGIPNPFKKADPQSTGLGGPGQRQYPRVNEDVYLTVPENPAQNLGNVLGPGAPSGSLGPNDVYGNVPGSDLGLPNRSYPSNNNDQYSTVPGQDLGLPGRVYVQPTDDVYGNVPGSDLGLPDRTYQTNNDDQYSGVPGADLGVPGRVYTPVNSDSYPDVPGSDLGLPNRAYPPANGDEYSNVPGQELGVPGRVYSTPNGDEYLDVPGSDLGLPNRSYPPVNGDEFPDVPGQDLGTPGRVYPQPNGDEYPDTPGQDLGLPNRAYPAAGGDEYSNVPGSDLGVPNRIYPQPILDEYPDTPGQDLGLPNRTYPPSGGDEYTNVPGTDLGAPNRIYPQPSLDEYSDVPGRDLGLPNRTYPPSGGDEYENNPGVNLGVPDRIYPEPNEDVYMDNSLPGSITTRSRLPRELNYTQNSVPPPDPLASKDPVYNNSVQSGTSSINASQNPSTLGDVYPKVPGESLGPPERNYMDSNGDEYIQEPQTTQKQLGRVYPTTDQFGNLI